MYRPAPRLLMLVFHPRGCRSGNTRITQRASNPTECQVFRTIRKTILTANLMTGRAGATERRMGVLVVLTRLLRAPRATTRALGASAPTSHGDRQMLDRPQARPPTPLDLRFVYGQRAIRPGVLGKAQLGQQRSAPEMVMQQMAVSYAGNFLACAKAK
jgi:hypothetical protein